MRGEASEEASVVDTREARPKQGGVYGGVSAPQQGEVKDGIGALCCRQSQALGEEGLRGLV